MKGIKALITLQKKETLVGMIIKQRSFLEGLE